MGADEIFEPVRVEPSGADAVYSLVGTLHPAETAAAWRAYVRENTRGGSRPRGVFALLDSRRVPHGLFAFRVARQIGGETMLEISEIGMLRLPGNCLVDALLRFANRLALDLDLPRIAIALEHSSAWSHDRGMLEASGFALDKMMVLGRARLEPPCAGRPGFSS